jgi:hypothetical protein
VPWLYRWYSFDVSVMAVRRLVPGAFGELGFFRLPPVRVALAPLTWGSIWTNSFLLREEDRSLDGKAEVSQMGAAHPAGG